MPGVTAHPFLSPAWIDAVREIRDTYSEQVATTDVEVRANVTVTDAPFEEPTVRAHLDTTAGALTLEAGHLDESDFAIEVPYEIAHQLFVDRDPQAVLPVLLGGQVKLTGDSSKIMFLAGMAAPPQPGSDAETLAREVVRRIDAITA